MTRWEGKAARPKSFGGSLNSVTPEVVPGLAAAGSREARIWVCSSVNHTVPLLSTPMLWGSEVNTGATAPGSNTVVLEGTWKVSMDAGVRSGSWALGTTWMIWLEAGDVAHSEPSGAMVMAKGPTQF